MDINNDVTRRLVAIGKHCLLIQVDLARQVVARTNHKVYIFDSACFFSTEPVEHVMYDTLRAVKKEGKIAFLSRSAQEVLSSSEEYTSLLPISDLYIDQIGVYLTP